MLTLLGVPKKRLKDKVYFQHLLNTTMTEQKKTGPKPKRIVEGVINGIPVGRDKKVIPPDQVEELAAIGCKETEIARFFGIAESTLRYNFSEYLTKGKERLKISLRRSMLKNACDNMNAAVQIFLAKNILGMADTPVNSDENEPLPWVERIDETVGENREDAE